jgi:SAM-dependent methyltransferase
MDQLMLAELYNRTSKHSNYQVLARPLRAFVQQDGLNTISRYEIERLDYTLSRCQVKGKVIADIGGNTGFFTLECAVQGASSVLYFEGNESHAEFVRAAVHALDLDEVVEVTTKYLDFKDDFNCHVDVCFLLNVLHHIGDDFDDSVKSRDEAKKKILGSLSYMSRRTRILVFQLGFNWKGDRYLPLFEHGTKTELIDFVRKGTAEDWEILNVGIAHQTDSVEYQEMNEANIGRDDSLGEFLNRPLFVMRSKMAFTD